ncbi:MAG: erythromycin esterase family protein [Anaerolineae bacterium]
MDTQALDLVRQFAQPLRGAPEDYTPLLDMIGSAPLVLLGEASHGTREFYNARAELTRRLISEKGFNAIAVEADWPDAYRVNRYIRGAGDGSTAIASLEGFKRFPQWMWRNADVLNLVGWLRDHNAALPPNRRVGFYGMDLYSLYSSMRAVIHYLDEVDPEAAQRARYRYSCFEHFGEDTQTYGYAASFGITESCRDQVVNQLVELQQRGWQYLETNGPEGEDEYFYAEQNARLAKDAEEYYRTMFEGDAASWNRRDQHMFDTLVALTEDLQRHKREPKIVVWAHNSHLGNAAATDRAQIGEWNVGQLTRERFGHEAVLVGFSTYAGTVTAASNWDGNAERKRVNPGMPGCYEALFHAVGIPDFLLRLRDVDELADALKTPRLERAIGVIYRPQTERISHYFYARLAEQFDALIHFDETRAVEPLERTPLWETGEAPETYPSGV